MLARYSMDLSVSASVTSRCSVETDEEIQLILTQRLPSTYSALCCKGIRVFPKYGYFPLESCSQLWALKNLWQHVDRRKYCQLSPTDKRRTFERY